MRYTSMKDANKEMAIASISMGTGLAMIISWSLYQSILWAMLHGFFGWFYVLYYALTR